MQPAEEIGSLCRARGVTFLLDAAQTLGVLPVHPLALNADLMAFPGHKGLLGPMGTGGLWIRPGITLAPYREGGTGSRSESPLQPEENARPLRKRHDEPARHRRIARRGALCARPR